MNYYEHHIGDFAQATGHLTFIEDAAFSRMLRKYYAEEKPLPAEIRAVQRLVCARTDEEREAVQVVLDEFFTLEADGWHNKRADIEIAKVAEKRAKASKSAKVRWDANASGNNANASDSDANASKRDAKAMLGEESAHNGRNALQSPDTSHQTPRDQEQATPLSTATPPTDLKTHRQQRLAQIADEALETFNLSDLVKSSGGLLPNVSPRVGREKRQQQVARCLRTAKAICAEAYDSQTITREFWVDYWATCVADDHKSGRQGGGRDHPDWKPSFEYLTREKTMLEVYDRTAGEVAA